MANVPTDTNIGIVDLWILDEQLIAGSSKNSINSFYDPTPGLPASPALYDRYISLATANGWVINNIYYWNGRTWAGAISTTGQTIYVIGGGLYPTRFVYYTGAAWAPVPNGTGDMIGPGASTDRALIRWSGVSGINTLNSVGTLTDAGTLNIPVGQSYNIGGVQAVALYGGTNSVVGTTLPFRTTGTNNVAVGVDALKALTSGSQNVGVGYQAGTNLTGGQSNVILGNLAGLGITNETFSTVIGAGAQGSGANNVTTIGSSALSGTGSVAIGYVAICSAADSVMIGQSGNIDASATSSVAIGKASSVGVGGTGSVVIGSSASSSANSAIAIGFTAAASGNFSISAGILSQASGINSIALGNNANASATSAIAIGNGAVSSIANQIMLGSSAQTYVTTPGFITATFKESAGAGITTLDPPQVFGPGTQRIQLVGTFYEVVPTAYPFTYVDLINERIDLRPNSTYLVTSSGVGNIIAPPGAGNNVVYDLNYFDGAIAELMGRELQYNAPGYPSALTWNLSTIIATNAAATQYVFTDLTNTLGVNVNVTIYRLQVVLLQ